MFESKGKTMAKFVCILKDEKKEKEEALPDYLLSGHIEHLKKLKNKGILVLCGPLRDGINNTGMIIIEANSMEEAKKLFLEDPFIINKWYRDYSIYQLQEAVL